MVLTQATHWFHAAVLFWRQETEHTWTVLCCTYGTSSQRPSASRSFTLAVGLAETPQQVGAVGENPGVVCISGKSCFPLRASVAKLYFSVKIKMFCGNMSILTPFLKKGVEMNHFSSLILIKLKCVNNSEMF